MFCGKCGAENDKGAQFCKACGEPLVANNPGVESKNAIGNENQSAGIGGGVDLSGVSEKIKAIPRKILLIGLGVVVAIIAIICIVSNAKSTINLNDFYSIETEGYDGYGRASASINWDAIEKQYGDKIAIKSSALKELGGFSKGMTAIDILREGIEFSLDKKEGLSNGDNLSYKKLLNEYNQENKSLNWKKVSQVMDGDAGESTSNTPAASIENLDLVIKSYDDYMNQNYNSEYGAVEISLIYINNDNVPEAIIQQDGDISWSIIGYEDGKAIELSGCVIDSLFYEPKGNHFFYEWSDGEESGTVSCTTNGNKVNTWSIDEIYTTQGTEYYYSDEKTNNKKLSESEAKKYFNEASSGCILYEGDFYSNAKEAFNNLKEVDEPIADVDRELRIKSVVASSTLEAKSVDGMTYVAENLYDDNYSTPWVEGVDGVGIGEKITIKLDGVHEINSLIIYNGILKSKRRCMINGQTTKIEIDWGDGNKQTANVDVNNYPEEEKAILIADLRPTYIKPDKQCKTDTITITILDAVSGSKYDDVGISEIKIYGK